MRTANATPIPALLAMMALGLLDSRSSYAGEKSWQDQTVLVSPEGGQTVVRSFDGARVLFKNADPKRAMEWGMGNARNTIILAGKYVAPDVIRIPRDDVTLVIDQNVDISLNPETDHTPITPGFRGRDGKRYPTTAVIYVKGRSHVRVICLGALRGGTFPVAFDGRNDKNELGIEGGLLLLAGSANDSC